MSLSHCWMRAGLASAGASTARVESGVRHSVATDTETHALPPTRSDGEATEPAASEEPPQPTTASAVAAVRTTDTAPRTMRLMRPAWWSDGDNSSTSGTADHQDRHIVVVTVRC